MRLLSVLFLLFSAQAFAAPLTTFTASGVSPYTAKVEGVGHFPTAYAACQALATKFFYGLTQVTGGPLSGECKGTKGGNGQIWYIGTWVQHVEECSGGISPDGLSCASCLPPKQMVDGQCVNAPNACLTKSGQSDNFVAANVGLAMCYGGCSMAMDSVTDFRRTADGPVLYHYTGSYTGESCSESVTPLGGEPPPPSESNSSDNCGPSSTTTDGEGRQVTSSSCTTTDTMIKNQACAAAGGSLGSFQGQQTCIQAGKSPVGTTKTTTTDVTTTKNPNGSTSTKTTTTTTTKTCAGSKPCTTTTTTTTSTKNTNGDGTSAGGSSGCKGDNCGTGGKEGTGSGGGGGGSSNDGDGEDDEEQEPIPGPGGSLAKGEQGNFAEGIAEWDERIRDISQELDQQLDQYSNLFSGVFDLNLGTGSGSLPCEQVPISFGRFGSTTLDMCLNNYADILAYLRFALMLGAAVLAAFIVMKD